MFLHVFDREVVDRQVFLLETFDFPGQVLVLIIQVAELLARRLQCVNEIEVFRELMVKIVMLNLHDRGLWQIPARPMRDRTARL